VSIKAYAEHDWMRDSVRVLVGETNSEGVVTRVMTWFGQVETVEPGTASDPDAGLLLREDIARAVYEALAEHFGHNGHDTRALRKDYDAERGRVDKLIGHLIGGSR
jgi:hypothetical protein